VGVAPGAPPPRRRRAARTGDAPVRAPVARVTPVEGTGRPPLGWRPVVTLALCVVGLGLALYTLWIHFQPGALACISAGPIDCQAVLTSAQSVVLGIPVPFFGIVFFLGMGALCLPAAWRSPAAWVHGLRLAGVVVGIASVIYLVSTELFTVKKICLWCSGVHLVTLALFIIVVTTTPSLLARADRRPAVEH